MNLFELILNLSWFYLENFIWFTQNIRVDRFDRQEEILKSELHVFEELMGSIGWIFFEKDILQDSFEFNENSK